MCQSMQDIIRFEGVCKNYGERRILDNFNLNVLCNEFITIIGASGCGKTTMLKMINGLHRPDTGSIYLWDSEITSMDLITLRRKIGYVIQGTGLFPHMDVRRNIAYVPSLQNKMDDEEIDSMVMRLMKTVGLAADLAVRYPSELSGGQQQRVGIARALAGSPEVMLMDEPFSAVDEITRQMLQEEILRIHKELSLTILFVTHDIRESCRLGSRMLVMSEGKGLQIGTPEEVMSNPADEEVRKLIRLSGIHQIPTDH